MTLGAVVRPACAASVGNHQPGVSGIWPWPSRMSRPFFCFYASEDDFGLSSDEIRLSVPGATAGEHVDRFKQDPSDESHHHDQEEGREMFS